MKKRRKKKNSPASRPLSNERFNNPFAGLDEMLKKTEVEPPGESEEVEPKRVDAGEEHNLFREAMAGVETLDCGTERTRASGQAQSASPHGRGVGGVCSAG